MGSIVEKINSIITEKSLQVEHIYTIYKVGSQLFRKTPNDLDFLILCEVVNGGRIKKQYKIDDVVYDLIFINRDYLDKMFSFDYYDGVSLFNYQYSKDIVEVVYSSQEIETLYFDPFGDGVEEKYKGLLKDYLLNTIHKAIFHLEVMSKQISYLYTVLKIYELGTTNLPQSVYDNINNLYEKKENYIQLGEWVETQLKE